jgi:hypothetical protein
MLEPVSIVPRASVISGHFPEITLRCMLHLFPLFICIFVQIFTPSFAEQAMEFSLQELQNRQDESNNDSSMLEFRQRIGYDVAVLNEPREGLILIDFRKITPPPFMTGWPYIVNKAWDPWNYSNRSYYYSLSWGAEGSYGDLGIDVKIFNTYEDARREFLSGAVTPMPMIPYGKCAKNIGTVCAMNLHKKNRLFFVYRNISVDISSATNDTIAEKTAEWLFEVLKAFPRDPMDAPFKLRNTLFSLEKQPKK